MDKPEWELGIMVSSWLASRRRARAGRRLYAEQNKTEMTMEMTRLYIDCDNMEWEEGVKISPTCSYGEEEPLPELPSLLAKLNIQPGAPIHEQGAGLKGVTVDTLAYHFKGLDLEENVRNIVGSGVGQNNATTPII